MSGGIAQLVAVGAQDAHLVGQPEVSFFRSNYKRHTNFAQTVERQVIQGNPSTGGMSTVRFERKGDMVGYVYITPNDGTKAVKFSPADWVNAISKVELLVGGQVIDEQTSQFSQYIAPSVLAQNLTKSTSGFAEAAESKFYPLRFSFCENAQTAIPLIALQYHDVELRITWGTLSTEKYEIYSQFIHLDTDERTALSSTPQNMLITQTQKSVASGSKTQEINFNHPVKYLVMFNHKIDDISSASKLKLQINGTDVTDFKNCEPHFTTAPLYYHTQNGKVDSALILIPFCLDTSKIQPTGSLNFSRLDSARILCDNRSFDYPVYGINYNILRIENGMGGLMYSN